jgi:predicted transcriptional regulator
MPEPLSYPAKIIAMAVEIVAAFVSHNSVPRAELSSLIQSVHAGLVTIATNVAVPAERPAPTSAVSIRQSIKADYLICLDDGKKFKSLRRHLTLLGMTPEQYRAKWNLPVDYPMVAPNYAAQRSELAKKFGLGQLRARPADKAKRQLNKSAKTFY